MNRVEAALDDIADTAFWQFLNRERLNGTPLYFRPFLDRKPERCAAAVTALASATSAVGCAAGVVASLTSFGVVSYFTTPSPLP